MFPLQITVDGNRVLNSVALVIRSALVKDSVETRDGLHGVRTRTLEPGEEEEEEEDGEKKTTTD